MFTSVFTLLPLALSVAASVLPQPRTIVSTHGRIEAPTTKAKVSMNTSIGIKYVPGDWCHTGYSPITVWVTDSEPTASSIDADTGVFKDGEFKAFIGSYTVPNYGLPPRSDNLPATITIPSSDFADSTIYLAIVETQRACPPGLSVPDEFGFTSTELNLV